MSARSALAGRHEPARLTLAARLLRINWLLVLLLSLIASIGFAMLYSAGQGSFEPWAGRQIIRFAIGLTLMLTIALVHPAVWLRGAYIFYAVALVLLAAVEIAGSIGMGARRWILLGSLSIQPSEVMKIALVVALARYFHHTDETEARRLPLLVPPVLLILAPAALVMRQPDLGTALMLIATGGVVMFVAGVPVWLFAAGGAACAAAVPVAWHMLHDYQRQRVYTFLDPERDPLGAGYHILQSKIALGSGGVFGKGFMNGTQAQLDFLPEKQTDFIFTMLAEELGMAGCIFLLILYMLVILYGLAIAIGCRHRFGRLLGVGIVTTFFLYVFINVAMVMGLVPVVGVPLPLVSNGGTAMLTLLAGFGFLQGVAVWRDDRLERSHGLE